MMRPENARMKVFLAQHGITATPKYLYDGSLKRTWRLWGKGQAWTQELQDKLNGLGFIDYNGDPLDQFSGNGGSFSVFVRGHNELLI